MKILRNETAIFRNSAGQVLKLLADDYVEPNPDLLQIEIEVDAGQSITIPSSNSFNYINTIGNNVSTGALLYDYYLNWGDGTTIVNVTTYNSALATHVYETAGKFIIEITSAAKKFPVWDSYTYSAIRPFITRVISWGDVGLKKINFYSCTALVSLPDQRSKLATLLTAQYFCQGCSSLSSIPYGVFFKSETQDLLATDFSYAFYNCSKLLNVHSTLFLDATEARNFTYLFANCVKITTLPDTLFYTCTKVTSFNYAFYSMTLLAAIPATLFLYNTAASISFSNTFYNCTSITTIPAGLFDTNHSNTFYYTFSNCTNLATIPESLFAGQNLCTTFQSTFMYCSKLQGIPAGVFDISVDGNNLCTSMAYCFISCGTDASVTTFTVADNLFDDLFKVTSFQQTFQGCSKFDSIPTDLFINCVAAQYFNSTFSNNRHGAIPAGLFNTCTEALNFAGCFASNTSLISDGVPAGLFAYCTKVTTFGDNSGTGVFSGCNNAGFTYIPAGIFANCINAVNFRYAFYQCSNLTTIPTDLLRYCTAATDVIYMFYGTKIATLTDNLFKYNPSITSVLSCFQACTSLVSIDENLFNTNNSLTNAIVDFTSCFSGCNNAGLTSIPAGLFQYSVNAKYFTNTFNGCNKVTSIPTGLFANNLIIETLNSCFSGWIISSIPDTLFNGLSQVSTVAACFQNCNPLTAIPATLFDDIGTSRTVDFSSCFSIAVSSSNLITGDVPQLWTKPNSPLGTACFRNRLTVNNYAAIPAAWK